MQNLVIRGGEWSYLRLCLTPKKTEGMKCFWRWDHTGKMELLFWSVQKPSAVVHPQNPAVGCGTATRDAHNPQHIACSLWRELSNRVSDFFKKYFFNCLPLRQIPFLLRYISKTFGNCIWLSVLCNRLDLGYLVSLGCISLPPSTPSPGVRVPARLRGKRKGPRQQLFRAAIKTEVREVLEVSLGTFAWKFNKARKRLLLRGWPPAPLSRDSPRGFSKDLRSIWKPWDVG